MIGQQAARVHALAQRIDRAALAWRTPLPPIPAPIPEPLRSDESDFSAAIATASRQAEVDLWQSRCAELIRIVADLRAQLARNEIRVASPRRRRESA